MESISSKDALKRKQFVLGSKIKDTHWISVFNRTVDEIKVDFYDICSNLHILNESMFAEIYEEVATTYNVTTIETTDELLNSNLGEVMTNIMDKYEGEIRDSIHEAFVFIDKSCDTLIDKCRLFARLTRKDALLLNKRANLTRKAMVSQIEYFTKEVSKQFSSNMADYLASLKESVEFIEELNKEDVTEDEFINIEDINNKRYKIKKIYKYEEMSKLAEDNNNIYKRSKGDHRIYEHSGTNKIVVIPAHSLGLGLSIRIQKQIFDNAS